MHQTEEILALDLARITGVLWAQAGVIAPAGIITTYDKGSSIEDGVERLADWLQQKIERRGRPMAIVAEAPLHPSAAMRMKESGGDSVKIAQQYAACVRTIARCYRVRLLTPHPSTVRKLFCGKSSAGSREESKNMVVDCAKEWGYMDQAGDDNNAADAAACHFWGSVELGYGAQLFRMR